ncbi:fatty acyl-AMP ligase [Aquabacterium sp. A7-Y]|uniref:fatty acyl-AMP ligase n=1 Tax=Aquabacterium sp. A7-Y TaxID=1349605 RepID=UPI00223E573E|nr:fatty acyl-AMP ligase [Aquabacterium sp. A7-Y]MCW7541683.1 fatty acyl-AMP ligase [Aquabacterium sp. A7-Y]
MTQHMDGGKHLSLVERLRAYVSQAGDRRAFVCLGEDNVEEETLTYRELDRRARALAVRLAATAGAGERALFLFPTCLSFVVAFFACLYAGVVAVPMVTPRSRRLRDSALAIARDCMPRLALTTSGSLGATARQFREIPELGSIEFIAVDTFDTGDDAPFTPIDTGDDPLVFLQYTSGSTSAPKGVMVSARNLDANLEMMRIAFASDADSTYVGWAPLFHDMGLISNVLEPFHLGALCVLMPPAVFAQRPWLWLKAISHYRARVSGGPNFAYDLCVERAPTALREALDLSCWRVAFNSAEPVRAATLDAFAQVYAPKGFRGDAFYPCYGMAEATLLVSGGPPEREPVVKVVSKSALSQGVVRPSADASDATRAVGCGQALLGETLRIVDPQSGRALPGGSIGEVWVSGPHIPRGYWGQPDVSEPTFHATLADDPTRHFLRTGDLGFLDAGELYIAGRLKDLIIARGCNFYPQDIERIAEAAHPGLRAGSSAAFAVPRAGTAKRQDVILAQEVERTARHSINHGQAVAAIRRAVFDEFELTLNAVVLVAPGSIPKTSSGKIKRAETRLRYLEGTLERIDAERMAPLPHAATPTPLDGGVGTDSHGR